ncbi:MAG: nucleotide exchange factor GrpE [Planctomycetota bacterium]|jgi:molecular chaperone GrpE
MKKKRDTKPSEAEVDPQTGSGEENSAGFAGETSGETPAGQSEAAQEQPASKGDPAEILRRQLERAKADLANIRKRHRKELDEARGRAIEGFATELLPVLDNFHLALDAHQAKEGEASDDVQSMIEGLVMVRSLLEGALERHGLSEIPSIDKSFDPNLHEAIGMDPTAQAPAGQITQVVQRGYQMEGRVLRASRVMVSGQPGAAAAENSSDQAEDEAKRDSENGD